MEIPNALPTFAADQTVADRYGRELLTLKSRWSELTDSRHLQRLDVCKGRTAGFEPATPPLKIECSVQLSYVYP